MTKDHSVFKEEIIFFSPLINIVFLIYHAQMCLLIGIRVVTFHYAVVKR